MPKNKTERYQVERRDVRDREFQGEGLTSALERRHAQPTPSAKVLTSRLVVLVGAAFFVLGGALLVTGVAASQSLSFFSLPASLLISGVALILVAYRDLAKHISL